MQQPPRPSSDLGAAAQLGASAAATRISVIGSDLAILGADLRIVSRGTLQIDGTVQGDVLGSEVIIGDEGSVTGLVNAEKVTIHGKVYGTVRAREVRLAATATVEGDIHHQTLSLEHGAAFEGSARRPQDQAALLPDLEAAIRTDRPAVMPTSMPTSSAGWPTASTQ